LHCTKVSNRFCETLTTDDDQHGSWLLVAAMHSDTALGDNRCYLTPRRELTLVGIFHNVRRPSGSTKSSAVMISVPSCFFHLRNPKGAAMFRTFLTVPARYRVSLATHSGTSPYQPTICKQEGIVRYNLLAVRRLEP
jgi:hypothetical protein